MGSVAPVSGPAGSDPVISDPVIKVRGLRKVYGHNEAVKGIDFDVAKGEIFGFLGTNGAGKTTTIEILEGYRTRTAGDVSVLGVDPGHAPRAWRERIGLVLQESDLADVYTVRETVAMFACYYQKPRPVDDTIDLVGLSDKRNQRIAALSGGQKRRLDVALGIIGDPELVFLDEPTTGFDPQARREAWNMIEGLRDLGKTVFLTTHYMDEAQHLADRLMILRAGAIVAQGTANDLADAAGSGTVVRFELANTSLISDVRTATSIEPDVSGAQVTLHTSTPQETLYRLTSWAEQGKVELRDLEVTRPSLDDVFLELTKESE